MAQESGYRRIEDPYLQQRQMMMNDPAGAEAMGFPRNAPMPKGWHPGMALPPGTPQSTLPPMQDPRNQAPPPPPVNVAPAPQQQPPQRQVGPPAPPKQMGPPRPKSIEELRKISKQMDEIKSPTVTKARSDVVEALAQNDIPVPGGQPEMKSPDRDAVEISKDMLNKVAPPMTAPILPELQNFDQNRKADEARRSKQSGSVQADTAMQKRRIITPADHEKAMQYVEEGTPWLKNQRAHNKSAQGALAKLTADALGFNAIQMMQPIAALFDTWGGRGKLQDIFKQVPDPKRAMLTDLAKLIEKSDDAIAKNERELYKAVLSDLSKEGTGVSTTAERTMEEGPISGSYRQTPEQKNAEKDRVYERKRIDDDVRRWSEKTYADSGRTDFLTGMQGVSSLLAKYPKGQLPIGWKGVLGPKARTALIELGYDGSQLDKDAVELQRKADAMLSALAKMRSGTAVSQQEFERLKTILGSRLTPESYVEALTDMQKAASLREKSLIKGYHKGAVERIYGDPDFITDRAYSEIQFKFAPNKESPGGSGKRGNMSETKRSLIDELNSGRP